ncbi:MAG: hypothetical protein QNJ88_10050 [Acidimicrobiia bacterium]|nr:hypothetical protein [Acidimicrobiia bacterium]
MMKKRGLAIMLSAFAVVLLGGIAVAQIADVLPGNDDVAVEAAPLANDVVEDDALSPSNNGDKATEPAKDDAKPQRDQKADEPKVDEPKDEKPKDEAPKKEKPKDEVPPKDEEPPVDDEIDTEPPYFVILSPENGAHVDDEVVTVSGRVEVGATVTFAGKYEARTNEDGAWWIALKLEKGKNVFTLYAEDEAGNKSSASITLYLDRENDHRFTANQKWEIVDGKVAANKYYGTAKPGAKVYVVSKAGGAETKVIAGKNGTWETYVEFPKAPCGQYFEVVVETDGARKTFEMKWHCEQDHEFTAHQKWEVVDGEPAANKYYGTGEPGTKVWIVSTDGGVETYTKVAENGEWLIYVEFPKAECNTWNDVVVEGQDGRKVFEFKYVCADEGGEVDFTANQQYGSCGEEVPYDVFWGTEDPGTKIRVMSDYGSGWTKANEHGEWEIRVDFPNAKVGKTFEVVIESDDGGRKVFTFTRTSGEGH